MGTCMSGQQLRSRRDEMKTLSTIPNDTQSINKQELPQLKFTFLLEEIRVRKCQYKDIMFRFKIEEVGEYSTNFKKMDQNKKATWRISHRMEHQLTEYDLRVKFLVVEAIDRSKEVLGTLNVNLYQIWRGPYHLNLPLQLPRSKQARISFNFKISQSVHIQIDNLQTSIIPNHRKNDGQFYSFWIEPIISQQLQPAKYAYFLKINDGRMGLHRTRSKFSYEDLQQSVPEIIPQNTSQKQILEVYTAQSNHLVWKKELAKELHLPQIDITLESYELRQTSLYVIFFNVVPGNEHKFQVDSSCFLSLSPMLDGDYSLWKDPKTKIVYHLYDVNVTHKLFNHGKEMGDTKIKLKIKIQSYQQQMMTCVRTQRGIQTETPFLAADTKTKQGQQIKNLKKVHNQVQTDLVKLQKTHQKQEEVQQIMISIRQGLNKQKKLIQTTSKQSIVIYQYNNDNQVLEGQRLFIDIGFKALAYIKQRIHQEVQELCWKILLLLLRRGEFALINIGFNVQQKQKIVNGNTDQLVKGKIQISIQYLELLHSLLQITLKSLANKGEEAEQSFAQSFCSYAYFRIPIFRQGVLKVIKKANDPEVQQWKAFITSMAVRQGKQSIDIQSFYSVKFNWQNNFYKPLASEPDFKSNQTKIQQVLQLQTGWKDRLSKRRGAFFTFLQNLVKDIEYVCVVTKYLEWQYLPGYNRLLYAFLAEMKQMPVVEMTDRFKRCLLKMLANEKILNVVVVMVVRKTNIYDVRATMATLSILDEIFKKLKKMDRAIPTTFDYKFLLQGIKVVLQSDYEYNISKVLIILYNHFNFFSPEFSRELILFLMSRYFYKFFFHWSYNLRRVFHTLIYVKVHVLREKEEGGSLIIQKKKLDKKLKNKSKQKESSPYYSQLKIFIIQRYEYLMGVIREEIMPGLAKAEKPLFKEDQLHKSMRHRLKQKKDARQSNELNGSKSKVRDPSLGAARFFSAGISKKMIVTKNKIYFKAEEMQVFKVEKVHEKYAKQAVAEYKALMDLLQKKYLQNPDYEPQLIAKKMKDGKEKQLQEDEQDEW